MADLDSLRKDLVQVAARALQKPLRASTTFFQNQLAARLSEFSRRLASKPVSETQPFAKQFVASERKAFAAFEAMMRDSTGVLQDSLYDLAEALLIDQLDQADAAADARAAVSLSSFGSPGNISLTDIFRTAKTSQFILSTNYQSRSTYQGLDQNNGKPVFSPAASYVHSSGLYAGVGTAVLFGQEKPFDQWTISGGYQQDFLNDRLSLTADYSHYFFTAESPQSRSVLTNTFSVLLTYETPVLTPAATVAFSFGGNTSGSVSDFIVSLGFSHPFEFGDFLSGSLTLEPAASLSLGTLGSRALEVWPFYNRTSGEVTYIPKPQSVSAPAFTVTDLTFSLPLTYQTGIIAITPELGYTRPLNQKGAAVDKSFSNSLNTSRPFLFIPPDKRGNIPLFLPSPAGIFYFTLGVSFIF